MSHDTDKLIRQLSLVAFLMAERRAVTARDIKGNVEGYSEMSDEAFARRFYSDRAELLALGVPLDSQRDEFTGEELYTLRSERYFLPPLELSDDELAALQTCFYLLEGKFAYAEPLRLALQNLALGRPGFAAAPTHRALQVEVDDPDYSAEMPGRLGKLESAIATRRERDFRVPPEFDIDEHRGKPNWQIGDVVGEARVEMAPDTAWWAERQYGSHGRFEGDVFVTPYSNLGLLASWVLRQDGRARPVEPDELRREVATALRKVRDVHEAASPEHAAAR